MQFEQICNKTCDLAREVGKFILEQKSEISTKKVEEKSFNSFVTYVDKTAEEKIVSRLEEIIPGSGILGEEEMANKKGNQYTWIIDPLDGTTNFIHGVPPFSISIALRKNEETILGVVYEINLDECFYSWKGAPAYLNGNIIKVSDAKIVKDSLISTGFPYYDYKKISPFLETLEYFMRNSHGIRRHGSAAVDLAYVACGRFDAFYEYSLHAWDVAAGAFLIKQAGGNVSDFSGGDDYIFGAEIIAANNYIFEEFKTVINEIMK